MADPNAMTVASVGGQFTFGSPGLAGDVNAMASGGLMSVQQPMAAAPMLDTVDGSDIPSDLLL